LKLNGREGEGGRDDHCVAGGVDDADQDGQDDKLDAGCKELEKAEMIRHFCGSTQIGLDWHFQEVSSTKTGDISDLQSLGITKLLSGLRIRFGV
jgi:hypothetical protein